MDFFVKLTPRRPNFQATMTEAEGAQMAAHATLWRKRLSEGKVVVFGPVLDPAGVWGMGVARATTAAEVEGWIEEDPARELMQYEVLPMQAVTEP
jgi:uncharacterized protein